MEIIKKEYTDTWGRKIKRTIIKTNCDYCSEEFYFYGGLAHFNRCKTHYCSRSCQGNGNNIKQRNELHGLAGAKRYNIWCNVKKRAKVKGQKFKLDVEDIPEIPEYCPVLGIKIEANTTNAPLNSSPSLDRIDNAKGYIKGNVQITSNKANRIKADATVEELEKVLNYMKRQE